LPSTVISDICSPKQGGYNHKIKKGVFGYHKPSDYMLAQIAFHGKPEVWQDFCVRATRLYGTSPPLQSIYLQKLDLEFEFGGLIDVKPEVNLQVEGSSSAMASPPPAYGKE
jgi:hypothetical protein